MDISRNLGLQMLLNIGMQRNALLLADSVLNDLVTGNFLASVLLSLQKKIRLSAVPKKGYRIADNETARGAERSRDLLDREMATLPKYDFRKYGVLTNVNSTAREVMDGVLELEAGGEPEMKIMQQFNERYDYVIIIAKNETDRANLFTSMEIKNERSNKQQAVGLGRVVSFERFQSLLKKWKGEK